MRAAGRSQSDHLRRVVGRILRTTILVLISLPLLYLAAALVGSLVPRNPDWQEPSDGIPVFVRSNGVHADLVLPASADGLSLYRLVPPEHVADPASARGWIAFGWGQREFYLETPRWADLTFENAARSIFGGDALMHIEHLGPPEASARMRPLRLNRASYRQLVAAIADGFAVGDDGGSIPLVGRGYGRADGFYHATGRYHAFRTSNQWTADALARAGVRIGVWTPFAQGIMWRFRRADA